MTFARLNISKVPGSSTTPAGQMDESASGRTRNVATSVVGYLRRYGDCLQLPGDRLHVSAHLAHQLARFVLALNTHLDPVVTSRVLG